MTARIVEGFEVIQVDKQNRPALLGLLTGKQGMLQPLALQTAVGQLGQRVVVGQLLNALLGRFALRGVVEGNDVVDVLCMRPHAQQQY